MFEDIKKFSITARYFLIATFLMGLSNGMFDAVYNFYLEARGIDKTATGFIYAVAMSMMAAAVVPLIYLSRKIAQKKLLLIAACLYSLPFMLLPVLSSVWASAVTLGLILSGMIALLSLGNALMGSHIDPKSRTTLFSWFFVSYLGAAMTGSVVVSIVTHFSETAALRHYQWILTASFISSLLMIGFRVKSVQGISEPEKDNRHFSGIKSTEWLNFITLFIAALLLGASITLVFRFINIVFHLAYTMNISEISLIMGADKIVSIIGAVFAPLIVKRFSLKIAIIIIGIMTFICLYLQSLPISVVLFISLYFIRLFLNYCLMPLLDTLAITGFAEGKTLLSTSIRQLSFYMGSALSAILYGDLLDAGRWEETLVISSVFALAGAVFMSLIRVRKE